MAGLGTLLEAPIIEVAMRTGAENGVLPGAYRGAMRSEPSRRIVSPLR